MFELLLAFAAGLLTLLNPCVLPLLPVVLAGSVSRHPLGPLALASGLALSFTLFGFLAYSVAQGLGFSQEDISRAGALIMVGFGAVLVVPRAQAAFARMTGALAGGGNKAVDAVEDRGLFGQFLAGGLLGLVWSPCVGPTLGGAIALAGQGQDLLRAFTIMASFSAGIALVVLGLGYGSRELIAQRRSWLMQVSKYAKPVMGVALIAVGLAIWFHLDRVLEVWALDTFPPWLLDYSVSI